MRVLILLMLLCIGIHIVSATNEVSSPPPLPSISQDEQKYLHQLYEHIANCPNISVSPSTRNGKKGDCVLAVYGGNTRLCINSGTGPGLTTTWSCVTLGNP